MDAIKIHTDLIKDQDSRLPLYELTQMVIVEPATSQTPGAAIEIWHSPIELSLN